MSALRRVALDVRILVALLVLAVIPRLPTLGQPLLERHSFRQTWTAWTAQLFHERGVDLLHPLLPIFGPPFVLPSEFPIFQAFGALIMALGVGTDAAMRTAGLITFIGCAVALWLLARDLAGAATALVAVAIFLVTPLAILWSRTSMIEYLALGAAIAFCWAGLRWRDGRGARWWAVALAFGLTAALVKPPTFVGWAIPLALARDRVEVPTVVGWLRARFDPRLLALGLVPLAASFAWLAYGDGVKASEPAAAFLQSSGSLWREYYYGTVADRLTPVFLRRVTDELTTLALPRFAVAFAALGLVATMRGPLASRWVAIVLAIVVPIEVFWGAYRQHDYYFIALSAQLALLAAAGVVWSWRRMRTNTGRLIVAALVLLTVAGSLWYDSGYWRPIYERTYDPGAILVAARAIASDTRPDDNVLVVGLGYDPSTLYYAQRAGLMLTTENLTDNVIATLAHDRYHTFYANDPWHDALWITRAWRFVGVRPQALYRIADTPSGVADALVVSTDDQRGADAAAAGPVLATAVRVPCNFDGVDVPSGRQGTLLQLRTGYPFGARLEVAHAGGPLPARGWVWLSRAATTSGGTVRVICAGTDALVIDRVIDAALDLH